MKKISGGEMDTVKVECKDRNKNDVELIYRENRLSAINMVLFRQDAEITVNKFTESIPDSVFFDVPADYVYLTQAQFNK